jgi:hypothetical protein
MKPRLYPCYKKTSFWRWTHFWCFYDYHEHFLPSLMYRLMFRIFDFFQYYAAFDSIFCPDNEIHWYNYSLYSWNICDLQDRIWQGYKYTILNYDLSSSPIIVSKFISTLLFIYVNLGVKICYANLIFEEDNFMINIKTI